MKKNSKNPKFFAEQLSKLKPVKDPKKVAGGMDLSGEACSENTYRPAWWDLTGTIHLKYKFC